MIRWDVSKRTIISLSCFYVWLWKDRAYDIWKITNFRLGYLKAQIPHYYIMLNLIQMTITLDNFQ